jgi:hypothetical protein
MFESYYETNPLLHIPANIMGAYDNATLIGSGDQAAIWRPNDGLVSLRGAQGDKSGFNDYATSLLNTDPAQFTVPSQAPAKGKFNYIGALDVQDHLSVIGLFDSLTSWRDNYYLNMANMLRSL